MCDRACIYLFGVNGVGCRIHKWKCNCFPLLYKMMQHILFIDQSWHGVWFFFSNLCRFDIFFTRLVSYLLLPFRVDCCSKYISIVLWFLFWSGNFQTQLQLPKIKRCEVCIKADVFIVFYKGVFYYRKSVLKKIQAPLLRSVHVSMHFIWHKFANFWHHPLKAFKVDMYFRTAVSNFVIVFSFAERRQSSEKNMKSERKRKK